MPSFSCHLVALGATLTLLACGSRPGDEETAAPASTPAAMPAGSVVVADAWARATPAGTAVGAAYFTVINSSTEPDTLLSIASPVSARAELHQTIIEDGMARMRPVAELSLSPGQIVKAEPGGLHVMLLELHQPLSAGSRAPLELHFRQAGRKTVEVQVLPATATGPTATHDHAGHTPAQ